MRKGWKRGHRLVVLPDYQGVGIGTLFHNYCAEIIKSEGYRLNSTTTTPALIHSMIRDSKWILKRANRCKNVWGNKKNFTIETSKVKSSSNKRVTFSFNYK